MLVPAEKASIIAEAEGQVKEIQAQYTSGLVTEGERTTRSWTSGVAPAADIAKAMMTQLGTMEVKDREGKDVKQDSFNSIFMMADSGARGRQDPAACRHARPHGPSPTARSSRRPSPRTSARASTCCSTSSARTALYKGLADTALKTANSGYLTRRLVDVTQDLVVTEDGAAPPTACR